MSTRGKFNLRLLLLIVLCARIDVARAEQERECISGEYVVTVSSNYQLKQRTIEELSLSSEDPIIIPRETSRVVLVRELDASNGESDKQELSLESENRLCARVRAGKRFRKRQSRHTGQAAIVRNISCSCNGIVRANTTPNDTYFSLQWGLHQPSNNIDIDAPEAWNRSTGSQQVVVAVVDTGIQYTHPDLVANMWRNPGEVAGNGIDDDGNGYVDDVHGINAINGSGDPLDDNGHGTHCAGIIGATGNNSTGVSGVNWNVSLMGVKFMGAGGGGSLYDAIRSLDYLTMMKSQYGVKIVVSNNSWGSQGDTWGPLGDAINRHQAAGILFVAAAGNSAQNIDISPSSPAGFGADSVVSVAAVDKNGALATFSNYGVTKVDIGAPGVSIASTYTDSGYRYLDGTSMAAPMVSGAIGLIAATYPGLTWQNYKQILMTTGKSLSALSGKTVTGKMINLDQLMNAASLIPVVTPSPTPSPTITPTPRPTNTSTPTPTPTATPTLIPGHWSVRGTVSGNGKVLANAVVRLTSASGTVTRLTDGAGQYYFSTIETSAAITLTVEASGFSFAPHSTVLQASQEIDFQANSLQFALRGRVLAANGSPVPGITVSAGTLGSASTDAQGYVRFTVPHGTQYRMAAFGNDQWTINDPERSGTVLGAPTDRLWIAVTP